MSDKLFLKVYHPDFPGGYKRIVIRKLSWVLRGDNRWGIYLTRSTQVFCYVYPEYNPGFEDWLEEASVDLGMKVVEGALLPPGVSDNV